MPLTTKKITKEDTWKSLAKTYRLSEADLKELNRNLYQGKLLGIGRLIIVPDILKNKLYTSLSST